MSLTQQARTLLAIVVLAISAFPATQKQQDLAGDWKYLPYNGEGDMSQPTLDDSKWPSMHLPSNWFLLGSDKYPAKAKARVEEVAANATGDLGKFDPEEGLDYGGTVWYRHTVEWTGQSQKPVILDLDMVDYYADVYMNGKHLAKHEGYFQKWSVNVTPALKPGKNLIALKVSAPLMVVDMAQAFPISWPKEQNQIKGIFAYHDTRPGATSTRGQERSTGGVIRGVALRQSSGVDIVNIRVLPLDVSEKSARLMIEATLRNWTKVPHKISLKGEIAPSNFTASKHVPYAATGTAAPGTSKISTTITVNNPALWWTWDYGKQNLYELK